MDAAAKDDNPGQQGLTDGCSAVITGASSGLGAEFARQLAPRAEALLLVARSAVRLEALAAELRQRFPKLQVITCACDLATAEGRAAMWHAADAAELRLNVLVNNAGRGDYGDFADADEDRICAQIDLNITAVALLARDFARRAKQAVTPPCAILNVSSLAASVPVPGMAVYAATKSFVSSLSEALAVELKPLGIRVLALCPGPTPTNFSQTARRADGTDADRSGQGILLVPVHQVVSGALRALEQGRARHLPGWGVKAAAFIFESLPRFVIRALLDFRYRRAKGV